MGSSRAGLNEMYFRHQRKAFEGGLSRRGIFGNEIMRQLDAMVRAAAKEYFESIGKNEVAASISDKPIFMWNGIHGSCGGGHMSHVHKGSLLSGVFYSQAPEGSGDIVFEDPRGASFDNRIILPPRQGMLILFPPWITHSVSSSCTKDGNFRVAVSFNIVGEWEVTADASVTMFRYE